jgi:predicted MFS family arabinose efflux permease
MTRVETACNQRSRDDGKVPPASGGVLPRSPALAPFRVRSFRFQWPADLLTSWAFEMETLILGWYVLTETGSVLMLTVFGALQYLGTLVAPMFGVVGDRIGQRKLLCGLRAVYTVLAATLMVLAFAGALTPTLVLVIAALSGMVRPSDLGVRSALVAETVPAHQLMAAMGISRTTSDSARIAGALSGAALFAALGMGPAYLMVTAYYALGLLLTFGTAARSSVGCADGRPPASPWRDLREGIRYVWTNPHLRAGMWLAFLVNLTAFPVSIGLLPYVAKEIYRTDQIGLGYLVASFAFGALLGSTALSLPTVAIRPARTMIVFTLAWFALLLVFAQMRSPVGGVAVLAVAGFAQSFSLVPLSVMLLRTSSEPFRGRVMGVRMLAIYSLPFGLLVAGALIERIGFGATATLYAVIGLTFTAVIAVRWRADLWRRDAPANAR